MPVRIHEPLLDEHRFGLYAALAAAQIITVAALGRAAWLAFFRPRAESYDRMERLHPGMITGFATLATCCVVAGVAPQFALEHVLAPATGSLLHPLRYAAAVLSGQGATPVPHIPFHYLEPAQLLTIAGSLVAGALVAFWYLRVRAEPLPVRLLRAAHNGSANDYAAYAVGGILIAITVLAIG